MSRDTLELIALLAASLATFVYVVEYHRKHKCRHAWEELHHEDYVRVWVDERTACACEIFYCRKCAVTHERLHIQTISVDGTVQITRTVG